MPIRQCSCVCNAQFFPGASKISILMQYWMLYFHVDYLSVSILEYHTKIFKKSHDFLQLPTTYYFLCKVGP